MKVNKSKFVEFDEGILALKAKELYNDITRLESEVQSFENARETGKYYEGALKRYNDKIKEYNDFIRDNGLELEQYISKHLY